MTIISDQHKSIEKAVTIVYPNIFRGACIFHLLNNIKVNFRIHGEDLTLNFVKAAKTYNTKSFEGYMSELDKIDSRIRPYLQRIGYKYWSRCHCPTRRYTMMTSNIAESINLAILATRTLPITTMMESLRSLVQKWVWTNGNEAHGTFTKVSTVKEKILRDNFIQARKYEVTPVTTILHQVNVLEKGKFLVNLLDKTCECNRFQQDEIPCAHAIAVFSKRGLRVYDYVADYYKTDEMKATYDTTVNPLPNESEWTLPESLEMIVLPPNTKKRAGRPRRRRISSKGEPKVQLKCGRCKKTGHNRKTCTNPALPPKQQEPKQPRRKKAKTQQE
ncbi:uncharacterized protein LOC133037083 [Cannabis sativa]|uniref:uncharacterized protein LOC133037083 n=1 Tax=Cannabis sativa TaxID=3483 RepID=UPI0029C9BE36|nr:uncharacterized protein LOC133037083 [Cannabis sativa]